MDPRTAKRRAAAAGLDLYWSREWQAWGLVDPAGMVDGGWISSRDLRAMTETQFSLAICAVHGRQHPDAGGDFPGVCS